jgi:hypothetical protein
MKQRGLCWVPACLLLVLALLPAFRVNCQHLSSIQAHDFASITANVDTIGTAAWCASRQCLYGLEAFAVAVDGDNLPLISAARYGSGRVIHFGHEGMLGSNTDSQLFKLVRNGAVWSSSKQSGFRIAGLDAWMSYIAASIADVGLWR